MPQENETGKQGVHIGGSVQGGNVVIGASQTVHGDLTIRLGNLSTMSDDVNVQLKDLVNQLLAELAKVSKEHTDEVQKIRLATEDALAEVEKEHPDKQRIEIRGKNLINAAKNLLTVAPIAVQIAEILLHIK